ncbi:hydroxymethylbilane synthase [Anaeromicropila herbilytica]|uniref:Hydroxymethylbilane synthase n=1 Tax=Anaeromicropila herbilytica TaxID=2785025 RepID=A0A7R7ENR1_9FIRM|nr:hydroxymethylbilane synthase [Anaeromicropila herbilytica]BCN32172.1 porphobilinogen deaminase [Anaeromicropila herbilytica]
MGQTIRIGTRKSKLALAQTDYIIEQLKNVKPSLEIEKVLISTKGDKILERSLQSFGGKGAFITEFEELMLRKEIDFAVHSAKDMPMELQKGLTIVAVSKREDPRDVLVTLKGVGRNQALKGIIGTCSLRRRLFIEKNYQATVKELRGNVETRLTKLRNHEYDGIILAAAGLRRLNLLDDDLYDYHFFKEEECIPAAGQGIIAVEGRVDEELSLVFNKISDKFAGYCLETEREVLRLLNAGCSEPVGAYAKIVVEQQMHLSVVYECQGVAREEAGIADIDDRLSLAADIVDKIIGKA